MTSEETEGVVVSVEPAPNETTTKEPVQAGAPGQNKHNNKVTVFQLYRYADGWDVVMMILSALTAMVTGLMLPVFTLLTGNLVNSFDTSRMSEDSTEGSMFEEIQDSVNSVALQMVILAAVSGASQFVVTTMSYMTATRQADRMRKHFFEASLAQEVGWYDQKQTGYITTLLTDIQRVQMGMGNSVVVLLNRIVTVISAFVISYTKGWRLALSALRVLQGNSAPGRRLV